MRKVLATVPTLLTAIGVAFWQPAMAQNMQSWQDSEQNAINQAQQFGAINGTQAARLGQQEAAINAQRLQYLSQNGGYLTNGERAQLGSELRQVDNRMRGDEIHDSRRLGHHGQWRMAMQSQISNGIPGQFRPCLQPGCASYAANANRLVTNANGFVPNPNVFVPNAANEYVPSANGYAQSSNYPNGQRGGMMSALEHLMGGQGAHNF